MNKESHPSLRGLIWRRFRRRRLGYFSAVVLALMILVFLFADFISPYNYNEQHRRYPYVPPMLVRIHISDEGGLKWPFVYGLARTRDPEVLGVFRYGEDFSEKYPIKLFVRGESYSFWGLFETDVHLFGTGEPAASPGQLFLFGTNQGGKGLFSQVLVGGRLSLALGFIVVGVSVLIGIVVGGASGFWAGRTDTILQRVVEVTMGLPRLALLLALSAAIPANVSPIARFWLVVCVLSLVSWAPVARIMRGQFLALREEEYVAAARATGAGGGRIIGRHILPNTLSYLIVAVTLAIPGVLVLESVLSFLGFGFNLPLISWGLLLNQAYEGFVTNVTFYPWLLIPGLFLFVTVLAFNLMGDALRDAVDPFTAGRTQ